MSKDIVQKVGDFVSDRWVSWVIEITILGVIAFFTITETRKTSEQTREMLARYDAALSQYTSQTAERIDASAESATEALKEKFNSLSKEDILELFERDDEDK